MFSWLLIIIFIACVFGIINVAKVRSQVINEYQRSLPFMRHFANNSKEMFIDLKQKLDKKLDERRQKKQTSAPNDPPNDSEKSK